jgi:hypothetical protein
MSCPSYHKSPDRKARVLTVHVYGCFNHTQDIKWSQSSERSDPLYRIVDKYGKDFIRDQKLVLPFPAVFGVYFQDFFRSFSLWRCKFNWNCELFISRSFVNQLLKKRLEKPEEGSLLFEHWRLLRSDICRTQCKLCSPVSICPLCEHTISHFAFALKAENKIIQQYISVRQLRCLFSGRGFPEFATHNIVSYIIGNTPEVRLVVEIAVQAIIHVNYFSFAEQIRSKVDRLLFNTWASAFVEGRLGQFEQEVFNSESLDNPSLDINKVNFNLPRLGNFDSYESYLLLPAGHQRDISFRNTVNRHNYYPSYPLLEVSNIEDALLELGPLEVSVYKHNVHFTIVNMLCDQ